MLDFDFSLKENLGAEVNSAENPSRLACKRINESLLVYLALEAEEIFKHRLLFLV